MQTDRGGVSIINNNALPKYPKMSLAFLIPQCSHSASVIVDHLTDPTLPGVQKDSDVTNF